MITNFSNIEKSVGHLCFINNGTAWVEYFVRCGAIYCSNVDENIDAYGYRIGDRWISISEHTRPESIMI